MTLFDLIVPIPYSELMEMKVVTKRHKEAPLLEDARILQRTLNRLRGGRLVPSGIYRFRTFEEADQWMTEQMAATHARRNLKTS